MHHISIYGLETSFDSYSLQYVTAVALLYFMGVVVYVLRVPERWFPGRFDIWGHSHQIWHIFVVLGIIVHTFGVVRQYEWWHLNNLDCLIK